jgi:hypothetical protein
MSWHFCNADPAALAHDQLTPQPSHTHKLTPTQTHSNTHTHTHLVHRLDEPLLNHLHVVLDLAVVAAQASLRRNYGKSVPYYVYYVGSL